MEVYVIFYIKLYFDKLKIDYIKYFI